MNLVRTLLGMLLLCLAVPTVADQAIVVRFATVYDRASSASDQIARIEAGNRVEIFERQGGWKQIYSEQKSIIGWVRSYQVRADYASSSPEIKTEPDLRGFLAGLASFSRKASSFFGGSKTTETSSTATIGVRGLSETEIKGAKPDLEELNKMQQFASNSARMLHFTQEGQLAPKRLPILS